MPGSAESAGRYRCTRGWDRSDSRRDKRAFPDLKNKKEGAGVLIEVKYSFPRRPEIVVRTLGDLIRKKRIEAGLKQKELAAAIGVDEMTVVNCERHGKRPMRKNMEKVIAFFGIKRGEVEKVTG